MELLSPAGNLTAAYAAFKGGADAVYIGGKSFSARASAENFSEDEIRKIVFYAHSIGRKVYVTLNTLIFQDEFQDAVDFAKFLYSVHVDGIIVQDLGLAFYLHKILPDLPLNASTQLNCHNLKQAEALIKVGFKRIVLARETDLETARKIRGLGTEVEVFGQGALCVSYSGNCLMSSFIGDRSGNRGRCAQPCRMRYSLKEGDKVISDSVFAISTKDLMTLDHMKELLDAGMDSVKIEGRLKSNEYIYAVTCAYRHAIDSAMQSMPNADSKKDKDRISSLFNRQFTRGYLFDESVFRLLNTESSSHQGKAIGKVVAVSKNRISIRLSDKVHRLDGIRFNGKDQIGLTIEKMFLNRNPVEEAVGGQTIELSGIEHTDKLKDLEVIKTKDYLLNKTIEEELKNKLRVPVSGRFIAKAGEPMRLEVSFLDKAIAVSGEKTEKAEKAGTSSERVREQLRKSGDFPYFMEEPEIEMDECFIPISLLNKLRNDAFTKLQNALNEHGGNRPLPYSTTIHSFERCSEARARTENAEQDAVCEKYGVVSYNRSDRDYRDELRVSHESSFAHENELVHFLVSKENTGSLIASEYCGITNSYALDCYYEFGFTECIVSLEADLNSIAAMVSDFDSRHGYLPNVGMLVYGKPDVMIMKSCPIGTFYKNKEKHCERCHRKEYRLVDRTGAQYRLLGDSDCNTRILNCRPINIMDKLSEIRDAGINNVYFLFTDETPERTNEIIVHYFDNDMGFNYNRETRGHYNKRPL